jgi:hypothetical protein
MSTAAAAPAPAAEKTAFGSLKDDDRIFQNIYGRHDISIKVRAPRQQRRTAERSHAEQHKRAAHAAEQAGSG